MSASRSLPAAMVRLFLLADVLFSSVMCLSAAIPPSSSLLGIVERDGGECSKDDLLVHQGQEQLQPNGIPTFAVNVLNTCTTGRGMCRLANIHISCGWFSSTLLVDPRIFRRLSYDDCLLNDGRPMSPGSSISFEYANDEFYPLSVRSASCVRLPDT